MQTGPRGSGRVSPRDVTGTQFRANLAAQKAKAEANDATAYDRGRKAGFDLGFHKGYSTGHTDGWNDLGQLLIDVGAITEERLLEIVNTPADQDQADEASA